MEVVPNAIDDDMFRPAGDKRTIRKNLGLEENEVLFGTVASLHPVKNHRAIIETLAILNRRGVRAKAVFVGDGVARAELERFASQQGVADQVLFAGRRRPSSPWFQALDFFVLASFWKGRRLHCCRRFLAGCLLSSAALRETQLCLAMITRAILYPNDSAKLADLLAVAVSSPAGREEFLAKNPSIPTCRQAALQLKRIYKEIA
jgi:hypothetical protein